MAILILTMRHDSHTDLLIQVLRKRHGDTEVFRFNYDDFPVFGSLTAEFTQDGVKGHMTMRGRKIDYADIRVVWNRRKVHYQFGSMDEQYVTLARNETGGAFDGVLHSLEPHTFWINPLGAQRVAHRKLLQLSVAAKVGFSIPHTMVTNDPEEAVGFFGVAPEEYCSKAVELGALGETSSVGTYTQRLSQQHTQPPLSDSIRVFPTLFQKYIPKSFEVRATVFGNQLYAAAIDNQSNPARAVDWRRYNDGPAPMAPLELPDWVKEKCLAVLKGLGLVFGCFDFIVTPDGDYVFLEVNPMGQFGFVQQNAGIPIFEAFADYLYDCDVNQRADLTAR
jgi:glutathione synthase/RimK-type ligase-like ATP-grasp enzyme